MAIECDHIGTPDYEDSPACVACRSWNSAQYYKCEYTRITAGRDIITRKDGLTSGEGVVLDNLVAAWNAFTTLPRQHPSELDEFCNAIHTCQYLLAGRVCRRTYPEGWPIKS